MKTPEDLRQIDALIQVMAALRNPDGGCPWDLEQDFRSIAPYTLEEAYEVADAIERGDMGELREELGDLLLQVVFHSRMAEEEGSFAFPDVVQAICEKMIRRHPHVFGDETRGSAEGVKDRWEEIKAAEKAAKGKAPQALLDDVPANLPGLTQAVKLQHKAAKMGFDWPQTEDVLHKIAEEAEELLEEARDGSSHARQEEEFGDLLFVMANLGRHLSLDPEAALRRANQKFRRRFGHIERQLGDKLQEATLEEMDALWNEAKRKDKAGAGE
ncbi:nucleoside triphosphate pyrophosphohydrolase [Tepidicaulis sp. LMO-SS28]|uniref:nucleoside triphosphate pyrophosphohydrolase n=1 Tax=Tepidicaulis sp. LMO-SS28 TaxID=3447455 RepID=UPI003EE3B418